MTHALPRYTPSGLVGPLSIALFLAGGLVAGLVALPYQYLLEWLPIIQLSVLLVFGFGIALFAAASYAAKMGHCRNRLVSLLGALWIGGAGLCGSYLWEARRIEGRVGAPIGFVEALALKRDAGWRIGHGSDQSKSDVSGAGTYVVWALEAVTVLGLALAGGFKAAGEPFCERCQRHCREQKLLLFGVGAVEAAPLLGQGQIGAVAELAGQDDPCRRLELTITTCPACPQTGFLSVAEKVTAAKGNRNRETTRWLVRHAVLLGAERERVIGRLHEALGQS